MIYLKQSTTVTLLLGPFLDETDGKTAETALTITQAEVRLSKNGGNMAQKGNATSCVHDELGYYTCPLSTVDTGTLGILKVMIHESGALPVWETCTVVTAEAYETLINDGVWEHLTASHNTASTFGEKVNDIGTASDLVDAIYEEPTANQVTASSFGVAIKDILTDTGEIGTAGAGLSNITINAASVDAILDETIGDGTITLRQAVRGFISALFGKVSGGGTATITFRNDADSGNIIVATVDANGNRSAVTFTP